MSEYPLLNDVDFQRGFNLLGLSNVIDGANVLGRWQYNLHEVDPLWSLAQWGSRYSFLDEEYTEKIITDSNYILQNKSKKVTLDKSTAMITLDVYGSEIYDKPRSYGEMWGHLLLSQNLCDFEQPASYCKVNQMEVLNVSYSASLNHFEDLMDESADVSMHAAQFQLFLYLSNLNPHSAGYKDMIWFGIPFFDNRHEYSDLYAHEDFGQEGASHKMIYTIAGREIYYEGNSFYKDGKVHPDRDHWINVQLDVLPHIKNALEVAHKNNFMMGSALADLFISGMNIGWEVPGTFDVSMSVKDLQLTSIVK